MSRPYSVDDAGFSLVECLIAVAILGIAFAALLGGMRATIFGSDMHRQQSSGQAVLLQAAEAIKDEGRNPTLSCSDLATGKTYNPYTGVSNLPTGWAASSAIQIVGQVKQWDGKAFVAVTTASACTATNSPYDVFKMQLVTLQVSSPDGRATETASVVKKAP